MFIYFIFLLPIDCLYSINVYLFYILKFCCSFVFIYFIMTDTPPKPKKWLKYRWNLNTERNTLETLKNDQNTP